ncbi:MAG: FGGY-family carbohydrate kinase [Candidatus Bathyarchaeia archaeon]
MSKEYIVAFDSGTQSVKTIIFSKYGKILGEGHSPHLVSVPGPMKAEQDPNQWWTAFCDSLKSALRESRITADRIVAVGITTQRETMCVVDSEGRPLLPAQVWYDARPLEQVEWIKDKFGAERYMEVTGRMPDTTWWVSKVLWVRDKERNVFDHAHKFLTVQGYFIYKLTGEFKDSYASPTGLLDMSTMDYSMELIDAFGIPREKLCDLVPPGTIIGYISSKAAEETGLVEGTPVASGAGDQQAGGLGAGLTEPGAAYLNLGTSVVLGVISSKFRYHRNFFVREGCIPGTWNFEALINGGFWMVTWFKENFAQVEVNAASSLGLPPEVILDLKAKDLPPGSQGLIVQPYWLGVRQPYWDEKARGTIMGWNNAHTKIHLYRAILEGIGYDIRLNLDGIQEALETVVDDIRIFGGGAKSDFSCQIMADILNKSVRRTETPEATTLGAAILAASAVKLHPSVKDAANAMARVSARFDPRKENVDIYAKLYGNIYRRLYPAVQPLLRELWPSH